MSTTPTGNFALTLRNLETLLCSSTTWQTACGVATVDAARDYVFWTGAQPVTSGGIPRRPLAWLRLKEGASSQMQSSGGGAEWHQIPLEMLIELADTAPDSGTDEHDPAYAKERQIVFLNKLGAIVAEMEALAKTAGYLWVTGFVLSRHSLSDPQESATMGIYQQALLDVQVF